VGEERKASRRIGKWLATTTGHELRGEASLHAEGARNRIRVEIYQISVLKIKNRLIFGIGGGEFQFSVMNSDDIGAAPPHGIPWNHTHTTM
jgi:hypothetical protein